MLNSCLDLLALWTLRAILFLLNQLPIKLRIIVVSKIVRLIAQLNPRHKKCARINLQIAFPDKTIEEREQILNESIESLARMLVDFARLPNLSALWFRDQIDCPRLPQIEQLVKDNPGRGILVATGHLSSFELLPHYFAMLGYKSSFVVRNFRLKRLDQWWTGQREASGCKVIARRGAFKEILEYINQGSSVGILFDQNVTANHAVFVDFFGKKAATSKALALAALRSEAPIIVMAIAYSGNEKYKILSEFCEVQDIYRNQDMSHDTKVEILTQRMSTLFEGMVRTHPQGWFWMHRRWKTRPAGEIENLYQ